MKIAILDKLSLGEDISLDAIAPLGELAVYDKTDSDDISAHAKDADIIILNKVKITDRIMDSLPKLKLICVTATGFDNIDIAYARQRGIAVTNVPGYSTDSVTLITIATVLNLYTKISEYNSFVRSGDYTRSGIPNKLSPVYHEIKGKTWGIIGYGNIGRAVARVAEALGARVIVHKRTPIREIKCVDFQTLCAESDIITVHCPLNSDTHHLIDSKAISQMKDGVIIVNEARGAVLDESAIADAVLSGKIGAFGSDVYSIEPFAENHPYTQIMNLSNVLLTPHCAWGAYESRLRCVETVASNISAFVMGKMQNRVDK